MGGSPVYLDPIVIPLIQGPRILDVGCGFGKWGNLCLTNYWETHSANEGGSPQIVGIDAYLPNVNMAKNNGCYTQVLHAIFPPLPFDKQTFDTVLMIEVVEHLQEEKAIELIKEAKRVAKYRVIISTPNFPNFREPHITITGLNDIEAHISFWSRRCLRQLGFRLYGAGWRSGGRYWRGMLRRTYLLSFYDEVVRTTLMSLSRYTPIFSENVIGVCDKG